MKFDVKKIKGNFKKLTNSNANGGAVLNYQQQTTPYPSAPVACGFCASALVSAPFEANNKFYTPIVTSTTSTINFGAPQKPQPHKQVYFGGFNERQQQPLQIVDSPIYEAVPAVSLNVQDDDDYLRRKLNKDAALHAIKSTTKMKRTVATTHINIISNFDNKNSKKKNLTFKTIGVSLTNLFKPSVILIN